MDLRKLLELRKQIKNKKPDFIRQDTYKKAKLKKKWRRPKGLHSKLRLKLRGRAKKISVGYRSPKKVRGLHKSGLEQKLIKSFRDLESLDPKKQGLLISSTLGNKKKVNILKMAKDLGLSVLNIKNPENFIKTVEDDLKSRKKADKGAVKESESGKKEEKLADKINEESRKDAEKKEKDKVLTKRQ